MRRLTLAVAVVATLCVAASAQGHRGAGRAFDQAPVDQNSSRNSPGRPRSPTRLALSNFAKVRKYRRRKNNNVAPDATERKKIKVIRKKKRVKLPFLGERKVFQNATGQELELHRGRDGRFFSLFTVVRFNNDPCPTSNGNNGTCYTTTDCSNRGGIAEGSCASGFGVCCFFQYQCGSSTSENGTYFVSPSTPERICNLVINRQNDEICQIRLELDTFDIDGPNSNGECARDFFLVTGGSQVPQTCGLNSGQHLIYSITSNSGPTQLSVVLDTITPSTSSRMWSIRIYQYECSSRQLAPVGCLQYFTAVSGEIQSLNYRTDVDAASNTNQLANLNYAICIRVANGYCGIRYSQLTTDPFSFTLSKDATPITSMSTFPLSDNFVMYGDGECSSDYVVIPSASEDGAVLNSRDRYCGTALGRCMAPLGGGTGCNAMAGSVTSLSRPFIVRIVTDEDETNDTGNRGFRLNYYQQPCLSG